MNAVIDSAPLAALPGTGDLEGSLSRLRAIVEAACKQPGSRLSLSFYQEHVLVVERFVRRLSPLLGARLEVVLPAALLHDIAAIEDFSRVSLHHELGAERATTILRESGFPDRQTSAVAACIRRHVLPVIEGEGTPEEVCLSNADALAQMSTPSYWFHYAHSVRALEFPAGRDWYLAMVKERWPRLHRSVRDLARPHYRRALGACLRDQDPFVLDGQ
jgi:uncharacterized protein